MIQINYTMAGIFVLIAISLMIWLFRINQKDKNSLRKILPGHKLHHRKHIKKKDLHI